MTRETAAHRGCLFCAIAAGQAPAHIVHESERLVAFLDIAPIRPGHLQIVPRDHYPHFNALPSLLADELLSLGQRLAEAQRAVFRVDRVGFLFPAGGEPHAQVEVVPLLSAGDVTRRRAEHPSPAQLAQAARLLRWELAAATAAPRA
ncbi:MAG: HIT family protein [Bacteroidota bacterium]|nr:HIT family protein [Kiloniellaceae bacterium]